MYNVYITDTKKKFNNNWKSVFLEKVESNSKQFSKLSAKISVHVVTDVVRCIFLL